MNILGTQYTLKHKSFEIYVAGCNGSPHCKGCHNPESWDFNNGEVINEDYLSILENKIHSFDNMINNIMIFGGEPLDQNLNELYCLLEYLLKFNKKIWLFTRYELQDVPQTIKSMCDYIKCGKYNEERLVDDNIQYGIKLATSNQKIYVKGEDY